MTAVLLYLLLVAEALAVLFGTVKSGAKQHPRATIAVRAFFLLLFFFTSFLLGSM